MGARGPQPETGGRHAGTPNKPKPKDKLWIATDGVRANYVAAPDEASALKLAQAEARFHDIGAIRIRLYDEHPQEGKHQW